MFLRRRRRQLAEEIKATEEAHERDLRSDDAAKQFHEAFVKNLERRITEISAEIEVRTRHKRAPA